MSSPCSAYRRRYDKKRRLKYRRAFYLEFARMFAEDVYTYRSDKIVWVRYTVFANSIIERVRIRARLKTFSKVAAFCKSFYRSIKC